MKNYTNKAKIVTAAVIAVLIVIICILVGKRSRTAVQNAEPVNEEITVSETDAVVTAEPVITPEITPSPEPVPTEDPYTYNDMYSQIYSHTDISDDARLENIKMAIEKINGVKIGPNEVFSFNDTVGSTSEYNLAAVYDSRYPEDEVYEIGGGVSLVASSVYCSSLYACMDPVERYPHHFWITSTGYLKRGCDAYVCNNGTDETVDMKFCNPFDTPVMIKAYLDENSDKLYVEFWGTNPEGWRGAPDFDNNSLYLGGEYSYVCNRYWVKNFRTVYNNSGLVRIDDINFDYDGDGNLDYDVYWWHDRDLVWSGGAHG